MPPRCFGAMVSGEPGGQGDYSQLRKASALLLIGIAGFHVLQASVHRDPVDVALITVLVAVAAGMLSVKLPEWPGR